MWYVYILRCCNGEIYKGCTNDLVKRLERHAKGWVNATCKILPVTLIMYVAFLDKYKAYQFEKYLKSGSVNCISVYAIAEGFKNLLF